MAQAILGYHSESRWLRYANKHLCGMFPYLPQRAGCNRRLRSALPLVIRLRGGRGCNALRRAYIATFGWGNWT